MHVTLGSACVTRAFQHGFAGVYHVYSDDITISTEK